ncbi:hypothetical protein SVIOM74S_05727 [Streptomyces violarus]
MDAIVLAVSELITNAHIHAHSDAHTWSSHGTATAFM